MQLTRHQLCLTMKYGEQNVQVFYSAVRIHSECYFKATAAAYYEQVLIFFVTELAILIEVRYNIDKRDGKK